jgi:hypothetical protein
MHRSGTSVATSLLEPLGVHLGSDDDLRDPLLDDPHGYWEHRPLKAVSEDLLHRVGADWHTPLRFQAGWERARRFDDLRAHARGLIETIEDGHPLWGWKDPRTCLVLPFWQPLLSNPHYVVCLRHPIEAARSLERRDALPLARGVRLWLAYTASALTHTAGEPRRLLFYEDVLADPGGTVAALAAFLDRPVPRRAAGARVIPERRHHHAATEASMPADVDAAIALYADLRARAADAAFDHEALDAAAARALAAQIAQDDAGDDAGWVTVHAPSRLTAASNRLAGSLPGLPTPP